MEVDTTALFISASFCFSSAVFWAESGFLPGLGILRNGGERACCLLLLWWCLSVKMVNAVSKNVCVASEAFLLIS